MLKNSLEQFLKFVFIVLIGFAFSMIEGNDSMQKAYSFGS